MIIVCFTHKAIDYGEASNCEKDALPIETIRQIATSENSMVVQRSNEHGCLCHEIGTYYLFARGRLLSYTSSI